MIINDEINYLFNHHDKNKNKKTEQNCLKMIKNNRINKDLKRKREREREGIKYLKFRF